MTALNIYELKSTQNWTFITTLKQLNTNCPGLLE